MSEKRFIQHDVENENENKNKNENENEQFKKNKIIREEPKEIKSPNWFDKNKFKEILATIDSNKFSYKNNISEFKYIGIKELVNNSTNNTISKIDAKKCLNTLSKIKNAEIKDKRLIPGQKELLNLFDNLSDIILTDKILASKNQENENEKVENKKEENKDEDYKNEDYENEDYENKYENKDEYKTIDQNEIIKNLNDNLDEIIDKSKSFEEQIKLLKKEKI